MKEHKHGSIVIVEHDDGLGNLMIRMSHTPAWCMKIENADRWDLLAAIMAAQDQQPFDKRCADAMADAIDFMVRTKLIDSRSPAADALLDYREGKPSTERSDQLVELETRNAELRAAFAKMSRETPYPDEIKNWTEQRGKILAELATFRNELKDWEEQRARLLSELAVSEDARAQERKSKDEAYRERNKLVIALANYALDQYYQDFDKNALTSMTYTGWYAGVGFHQPNPDPTWDPAWLTVLFIDTPAGQLSWHLHDRDRPLLDGLPKYLRPWDGHTTEEKYKRLERLWQFAEVVK